MNIISDMDVVAKITRDDKKSIENNKDFTVGFELEVILPGFSWTTITDYHGGAEVLYPLQFKDTGEQANDVTYKLIDFLEKNTNMSVVMCPGINMSKSKNKQGYLTITNDSSIVEANYGDDRGIEIVTPIMGMQEALQFIDTVFPYLSKVCKTDIFTGLHINLGIKGINLSKKVDKLKLALFLEEPLIYKELRLSSIQFNTNVLDKLFAEMQEEGLDKKMSIKDLNFMIPVDKYLNVNFDKLSENYLEFRSPGGKEYLSKGNLIRNILLTYAYALYISTDTKLRKEEYKTKVKRFLKNPTTYGR